jgi:hypothetical protein
MPPQPIDRAELQANRCGQGCHKRRCSTDPTRRAWYAAHRSNRFARRLAR